MRIAWVAPCVGEASGGMRTIVQAINVLADIRGHSCSLYLNRTYSGTERYENSKLLLRSEYGLSEKVRVYDGPRCREENDCLVATMWDTVDFVLREKAAHKVYFVQDFEPWFYSMGDQYLDARQTYRENLKTLTIGRWLAYKLNTEFNAQTSYFDFCADQSKYYSMNLERSKTVCAVYQPEKPRRCDGLLIRALRLVKEIDPEINVIVYGSSQIGSEPIDFEHENLGIISVDECNTLYNSCRVGVCCSSSNPSRIPFEMMSTGLPVVDLFGENTSFDYPKGTVCLSEPTPEAIATAVLRLMSQDKKYEMLLQANLEFMKGRTIEKEITQIADFFDDLNKKSESAYTFRTVARLQNEALCASDVIKKRSNILSSRYSYMDALNHKALECDGFEIIITTDSITLDRLRAAVWCLEDSSDLVWYDAEKLSSSTYSVFVSCGRHGMHSGLYKIHVYGDIVDGTKDVFLGGTERVVLCASAPDKDSCEKRIDIKYTNKPIIVNVDVRPLSIQEVEFIKEDQNISNIQEKSPLLSRIKRAYWAFCEK